MDFAKLFEIFGPSAVVFVAGYFSVKLGLNGNTIKISNIEKNVNEMKIDFNDKLNRISNKFDSLPCFDHEGRIAELQGMHKEK